MLDVQALPVDREKRARPSAWRAPRDLNFFCKPGLEARDTVGAVRRHAARQNGEENRVCTNVYWIRSYPK